MSAEILSSDSIEDQRKSGRTETKVKPNKDED